MLAFNLRSPLFRDGAYQSFDLYIIVKRGHSDVNKKHFRVPPTNILLFQRTYLEDMGGFEPPRHHYGLFNQTFVWSQAYPFTSTDYTNLSTYPKVIKVLYRRFPQRPPLILTCNTAFLFSVSSVSVEAMLPLLQPS